MSESWLYPITLNAIAAQHALNLLPLMDFGARIPLPSCSCSGTGEIQIDVVAAEIHTRALVIAECKDFLTFQGVSECAEQLILKTYLLKTHLAGALGDAKRQTIDFTALPSYSLIRYVSLGSHQGMNYANAKTHSDTETRQRLAMFLRYLKTIGRCELGVLLFRDKNTPPIVKRAAPRKWIETT